MEALHEVGFLEAAGALIASLVGIVLTQTARWISRRIRNEWVAGVIDKLMASITVAVDEVQQVYVNDIKRASSDGKLTQAERDQAKSRAVLSAKAFLGKRGLAELVKAFGFDGLALDTYLGGHIEAAVGAKKNRVFRRPPPRAPLPIPPEAAD